MTPFSSANYGADSTGLICGFQFGPDGKGTPVGTQQALQWLAAAGIRSGTEFVWLHFNLTHAATARWLREHLQLSDVFHESLKDGPRSTRVELDDDMLIAVVNDVRFDFAFAPTDIATLWLSVGSRLVVSARLQPLRSTADRIGPKLKNSIFEPRVNVNKQLAKLLSGYQDLMDRYGTDDPLVQDLKAEVDRHQLLDHALRLVERRRPGSPSGVWNRATASKSAHSADLPA